eukprot:Lankesteria_metandrocarpae@DN6_c0_g1_i1.p1
MVNSTSFAETVYQYKLIDHQNIISIKVMQRALSACSTASQATWCCQHTTLITSTARVRRPPLPKDDNIDYYCKQLLVQATTSASNCCCMHLPLQATTTASNYYCKQLLLQATTAACTYYCKQLLLQATTTASNYYCKQLLLQATTTA